jgi:hypothetical protein
LAWARSSRSGCNERVTVPTIGGDRIPGDDNRVTFACENAVLGECVVQGGYWPWLKAEERSGPATDPALVSWRALHQACVRMVRADICRTGDSFTVPGTPINVEDRFSIQTYSVASLPAMVFEGYWDAGGILAQDCARYEALAARVLDGSRACPALDRVARVCPAIPPGSGPSGLPSGAGTALVSDAARWRFSDGAAARFTAVIRNQHAPSCQLDASAVTAAQPRY